MLFLAVLFLYSCFSFCPPPPLSPLCIASQPREQRHYANCPTTDDTLVRKLLDEIMQRSNAAEASILIETEYKFTNFEVEKLILEISDRGWNVKSSNKLKISDKILV